VSPVMRAIIHVDMDAFYASVEQRDNPELRGKPLIVGGDARRGVVVAASYEVRKYGVKSAMPMARALKLAPHAKVVRPRFSAYSEASEQVSGIFERYTPLVEPLSLDEAFLDVTASVGLFGAPTDMARRIRKEIAAETGLPSSAGIASVKFVAKIASDLAKPNGQREVRPEETVAFLAGLPVARLWGVGPKTEEALKRAGLERIGQIAEKDAAWMEARWGASGRHLWELARGIDAREVVPDREAKSVGAEDTFDEDLTGMEALAPHVHAQALRVARRLRRAGVKGRVVQLKVKFWDFTLVTRRTTLPTETDDGQMLYRVARELLEKTHEERPVRLTGVSVQELGSSGGGAQLGLFTEAPRKSDKLNSALDRIAEKFGTKAVRPADIADSDEPERPRNPKKLH
jgi:DNA polymerase IV